MILKLIIKEFQDQINTSLGEESNMGKDNRKDMGNE